MKSGDIALGIWQGLQEDVAEEFDGQFGYRKEGVPLLEDVHFSFSDFILKGSVQRAEELEVALELREGDAEMGQGIAAGRS